MWCCLFADPACRTVRAEDLDQNYKQMGKFARAHRKKHKIWPHPAQAYVAAKVAKMHLKKKKKQQKGGARGT